MFTGRGTLAAARKPHRRAQGALNTRLGVPQRGEACGISPEGTRSRDGRLARGKTGVAWLALTADCPVVPVAVAGTDRAQPVGARWPRPRRVSVAFGEPPTVPEGRGIGRQGKAPRGVTHPIMGGIAGPP